MAVLWNLRKVTNVSRKLSKTCFKRVREHMEAEGLTPWNDGWRDLFLITVRVHAFGLEQPCRGVKRAMVFVGEVPTARAPDGFVRGSHVVTRTHDISRPRPNRRLRSRLDVYRAPSSLPWIFWCFEL